MSIPNTRLWEAIRVLSTGEGASKARVVAALELLMPMGNKELPDDLQKRLETVRHSASQLKPNEDRNPKISIFQQVAKNKINRTYTKYAIELMNIYDEYTYRINSGNG